MLPTEKAKLSAPSGWRDTSDTDTGGGTCPPGPHWWRQVGCRPLHPAGQTQAPVYPGRTSPATHHGTTFSRSQIGAGYRNLNAKNLCEQFTNISGSKILILTVLTHNFTRPNNGQRTPVVSHSSFPFSGSTIQVFDTQNMQNVLDVFGEEKKLYMICEKPYGKKQQQQN